MFRDVSEKVIIEAKEFLYRKFEITKYGLSVYNKLGGRKGKWKKERTEEQLETFKIKSLREFSKKKIFSYDLSFLPLFCLRCDFETVFHKTSTDLGM
jgi:hypothetical protein